MRAAPSSRIAYSCTSNKTTSALVLLLNVRLLFNVFVAFDERSMCPCARLRTVAETEKTTSGFFDIVRRFAISRRRCRPFSIADPGKRPILTVFSLERRENSVGLSPRSDKIKTFCTDERYRRAICIHHGARGTE